MIFLASRRWRRSGMTLVEMLVVIAIMAVLMALSLPSFTSISESNNLSIGGQLLSDQIRLGTQIASAQNQILEVRLIKRASIPGAPPTYCALQLWTTASTGTMVPAGKITFLPQNIAISENAAFSPLLSLPNLGTGTLPGGSPANSPYVSFKIHPCGYFEPVTAKDAQLYVTLVQKRFSAAASLPANYVMVQISPYTCSPTLYRP